MSQYYPSEPWNYEYETARTKQSVTSVLWNIRQRKEYERRKKQKAPRARESVNENITASCSRFTFHHRPTKDRNVTSANKRPLHPHPPPHPPHPPPPPPPQHSDRSDRRPDDRPSCHRPVSGQHSTLGYNRDEHNSRSQRGVASHGREQSTVRKRAATGKRQEKNNGANEPIGVKGAPSLSSRQPAKDGPHSSNAGAVKPRRNTPEQKRSPQAPLQTDQQPKQQIPKRSPTQPSATRKRTWKHATLALTPDSDEDDSDEDDSDEGEPSTKLSRDSDSDESADEERTRNTRFHAASDRHRNHGDADSVYSNPKTTQSCSSVSSDSSSGTNTGSSSSSATESEDETPEDPTPPYRPQSAQLHQSPPSGPTVPRKVCKVEQAPPGQKRPHQSGDFPTKKRPASAGKGANASRPQAQAACVKKISKSDSRVEKTKGAAANSSAKNKPNSIEPKTCRNEVLPSTSIAPKQQKPSASNRRQRQKPQEVKPHEFKKPSSGRAKPGKKPQEDKNSGKQSTSTASTYCEPTGVEDRGTVDHTEAAQAETPDPCDTLFQMCNDLNDIPIPFDETAQACASLSCPKAAWSELSHAELEVWEESLSMVTPSDITAPMLDMTAKDAYEDCELNHVSRTQSPTSYYQIAPDIEEMKCKTPPPQMTLDSLCEESVVNFEMFLNPNLSTLSATADLDRQHPSPRHTSPQAATQQPHTSAHPLPLNVQINIQTMQESANYINTLQRSQCVTGDNADCTVVRAHRDATHSSEQHVPSRDDVLCSVSSSLSSSHNVEPVTLDNLTNPLPTNPALYDNSFVTENAAEHPDHKDGSLFQRYDMTTTPLAPDSGQHRGVNNTLDNRQASNALEATVPYHNVSPVSPVSAPTLQSHTGHDHPRLDDSEHCLFLRVILEIVSKSIKCTVCQCTFNASVLCNNYAIKLNRPIQCACGCVICSMCYSKDEGCLTHKVKSRRATVNVTANQLANAADVKWDLELDKTADFRTECDYGVQSILHLDRAVPTADELKEAFQWLIDKRDEIAFKYWDNTPMPELMAYKYVCISHIPGFWDHIILGRSLATAEVMLAADEHMPRLFDVNMFGLSFHWCCFVFETQTILAMWCSARTDAGLLEILPITDRMDMRVKRLTSCNQFNSMLYYLHRWLRVHYGKGEHETVQVAFDCMPSEGLTFAHFISMLAAKIGLGATPSGFLPAITQFGRTQTDLNYTIDTRYPEHLFSRAPICLDGAGATLDIRREFGYHGVSVGMMQLYTDNDHSIYA